MKTFIATVEDRYVWDCPYCGEICDDISEDPETYDSVICEHCGEESKCEYTER